MITSRQNSWVARIRKTLRKPLNEIVIEGPKQLADAIRCGMEPIAILSVGEFPHPSTIRISEDLGSWIGETRTSQGVFGLFARPEFELSDLERGSRYIVALDGVQDPGNVGTIVRLASAFEACGVITLPGTADPWGARVIRASAGEVLNIPIVRMTHEELLAFVSERGLALFCAESEGGSGAPPSEGVVLVFGSEGQGVTSSISAAGRSFTIGMSSSVESINVGSAAAIVLHRAWLERDGSKE